MSMKQTKDLKGVKICFSVIISIIIFVSAYITITKLTNVSDDRKYQAPPYKLPITKLPIIKYQATPYKLPVTKLPIILIYTPFFGELPWHLVYEDYFDKCSCKTKCKLTYDKQLFSQSDVVLFHGRDMPDYQSLYTTRPKHQKWGYFILESPMHAPPVESITKYFDFSISPSFKSNIQWNFVRADKIDDLKKLSASISEQITSEFSHVEIRNYAKDKTKHVAWYVSNCGASDRMQFVKQLEQHGINVYVGGGCSQQFTNRLQACSPQKGYESCKSILKEFKFYFAAENSFCTDYVTEKYFIQGYIGETIPIVLGAANYSRVGIPGSYLNPLDFENFQKFVDHLKMLDRNDTAYNEYFKWKPSWISYVYAKFKPGGCSSFICSTCEKLHEQDSLVGKPLDEQISKQECYLPTENYHTWLKRS